MSSILNSVKKQLGIVEEYTIFDSDIIMHINSVLSVLAQIGVGPAEGFAIEDASATWDGLMGTDNRLNMVRSYVGFKIRMMFDPPTSPSVSEAIKRSIDELEWRLNVAADQT